MRFAELEFSVDYSFVWAPPWGAAPTPLALPCPFRTSTWERGRMPSETSGKLQKYRMSRRNFGNFGWILMSATPGWFRKSASIQTVLDNVWNFAVAYSRALVYLLYFFTSSFGLLLGLLIAFVSARFASWKFNFLVWVHLKRDTNYRRYPTTSWHKLQTARRFVTKKLPNHGIMIFSRNRISRQNQAGRAVSSAFGPGFSSAADTPGSLFCRHERVRLIRSELPRCARFYVAIIHAISCHVPSVLSSSSYGWGTRKPVRTGWEQQNVRRAWTLTDDIATHTTAGVAAIAEGRNF